MEQGIDIDEEDMQFYPTSTENTIQTNIKENIKTIHNLLLDTSAENANDKE